MPKIIEGLNSLTFHWEDTDLKIFVRRIREAKKESTISGLVSIYCYSPSYTDSCLMPESTINLSAPQTRRAVIKDLTEHHNQVFKGDFWHKAINLVCTETQRIARRGEDVKEIDTEGELPKVEYFVEPLAIRNEPTIFFGDGGTGKSYIGLMLYLSAMFPYDECFNKLGLILPTEPETGIYLDWERGEATAKRRLHLLETGLGLPPVRLKYRHCSQVLANEIEAIAEFKQKHKATFFVHDSLAGACGGDLNLPEPATLYFNALRSLGEGTHLILAHTRKGDGEKKSIFGSAIFTHRASSVWEVQRSQGEDEDNIKVALFHRKSNLTRLHPPIAFDMEFSSDRTTIKKCRVEDIEAFKSRMSVAKQIQELLKHGSHSQKDMSDVLGLPLKDIYPNVSNLKRDGRIIQLPDKSYGLPLT